MISFKKWLQESSYGQVYSTLNVNDEFMQTRVNSGRMARVAFKDMSDDKANCNYLKVDCKKRSKKGK
jgi:hypothetical protein